MNQYSELIWYVSYLFLKRKQICGIDISAVEKIPSQQNLSDDPVTHYFFGPFRRELERANWEER